MPSNTGLVSGPAVETAQTPVWPSSCMFLPPMSTATELVRFLFWELSLSFCIFHRHRVGLVDHGDLICSLYKYWEGFRSSSLGPLPLGFNCGFTLISVCRSSTEVCSWGCPGGLVSAPSRKGCEGGTVTWISGTLTVPGMQGSWCPQKQETWCS